MNMGPVEDAPEFDPGLNHFSCLAPTCITFTNKVTGEIGHTFVCDTGSHFIRVPTDHSVSVDCAEDVKWNNRKYDPVEYPDDTPVELTVIRPRSMQDEIKDMARVMVARHLGIGVNEVELPGDFEDFDLEDDDDAPLSLHQIRVMEAEVPKDQAALKPSTAPIPAPVETEEAPAAEENEAQV